MNDDNQRQDSESHSFGPTPNDFQLALNIVEVWATSLQVFLRTGFGERYPGGRSAGVLLLVPVYIVLARRCDALGLLEFLGAFLALCFVHRSRHLFSSQYRQGGHSRYTGRPLLLRLFPRLSEATAKSIVEPIVAVGIGVSLLPWNQSLGVYWIIGAFALMATYGAAAAEERRRLNEMRDSMLESQRFARQFHEMFGDH